MTIHHPTSSADDEDTPSEGKDMSPTPPVTRLAYSVNEAAQLTGLSRDLLYDEMRRGNLDYLKVGRRRLITHQHLERFLGMIPRQPSAAVASVSEPRAANREP